MNSGNIEDMLKLFSIQFRYVLAGIIAWGIGCGKDGLPGVYASVRNALCFIDWDTKCKHGSDFIGHYDYSNDCTGWIDKLIDSNHFPSCSDVNITSNDVCCHREEIRCSAIDGYRLVNIYFSPNKLYGS